jgi:hypothetical protein
MDDVSALVLTSGGWGAGAGQVISDPGAFLGHVITKVEWYAVNDAPEGPEPRRTPQKDPPRIGAVEAVKVWTWRRHSRLGAAFRGHPRTMGSNKKVC